MKEKIFIGKWLIAVFIGLVAVGIGVVGFIIAYVEMGIIFSLLGAAIIFGFVAFVPHTFIFDNEKITTVGILIKKEIKYANIKTCEKQESGIRNYPWGIYYHIIADKPYWQEINMPSTKGINDQIRKYIKID